MAQNWTSIASWQGTYFISSSVVQPDNLAPSLNLSQSEQPQSELLSLSLEILLWQLLPGPQTLALSWPLGPPLVMACVEHGLEEAPVVFLQTFTWCCYHV